MYQLSGGQEANAEEDEAVQPYVYTACGHVHSYSKELAGRYVHTSHQSSFVYYIHMFLITNHTTPTMLMLQAVSYVSILRGLRAPQSGPLHAAVRPGAHARVQPLRPRSIRGGAEYMTCYEDILSINI